MYSIVITKTTFKIVGLYDISSEGLLISRGFFLRDLNEIIKEGGVLIVVFLFQKPMSLINTKFS